MENGNEKTQNGNTFKLGIVFEIDETRVNGTITNLHIQAKQVDQCSF